MAASPRPEHRGEDGGTHIRALLAAAEDLVAIGSFELDLATRRVTWSEGLRRIYGVDVRGGGSGLESLVAPVHPDDRERVREALLAALDPPEQMPAHGVTLEYRVVRADGSVRELRAQSRLVRDERGSPRRRLATVHDVTEQRMLERELRAHHAVGQALGNWRSFDEGTADLLRRLGGALGVTVGSLWTWRAGERGLGCRAFWSAEGRRTADFEAATRSLTFAPGRGIPGRAWATAVPVIASDLAADREFCRLEAAAGAGLRSALAFPAIDGDRPLAVLDLYSADRVVGSERLMRTLTGIGRELGRFLRHRGAQPGPRRLSARELQVLRLAAEGNSGPQIAARLMLSPATVKTHFENIYEKLGAVDRASAVAHALRGLID